MPVAEFAGRFGWGYDGVDLFAPSHLYGAPDDLRALHRPRPRAAGSASSSTSSTTTSGPPGTTCAQFSPALLHATLRERVGRRDQLRRPRRRPVRELFVENAAYWIDEFHFDGLRLDATQTIYDASPEHIIAAIARARARGGRRARDVPRRRERAAGRAAACARRDDGRLRPRRAVERRLPPHRARGADRAQRGLLHATTAARRRSSSRRSSWGFLYQGQRYAWQKKRARHAGAAVCAPSASCTYLENHDQVANTGARRTAATRCRSRARCGR